MTQTNSPATNAVPHTPVRTTPLPGIGPRYTGRELEYLKEALTRNNLFYNQAEGLVSRMLARAKKELGAPFAVPASSGTASLHVAVAGLAIPAGHEIITSPITDMGTAIAILYQNCIPTFAEVDPRSFNLTAKSIEAAITDRTRAVLLVHLAGTPADLDEIVALCKRRNLKLIEDCAQSWGATYKGKAVGNFGDAGCYSLNDYKHLSCGDGGFIITHDEAAYRLMHNCADKFYDRLAQGNRLAGLGANYRMTELQGAVALAQFDKLASIVQTRRTHGDRLSAMLGEIPGILPPLVPAGGQSSYWFYMFRVDEQALGLSRDEFVKRVQAEGIPASAGYLPKPLCHEPVFLNKNFFAGGVWPAEVVSGKKYDYAKVKLPVTEKVLATAVRFPLHEGLAAGDIDDMAAAVRKVAKAARG